MAHPPIHGRPPEAAPTDFYTDPETDITYIRNVPFSGDGSESNAKEGVALATVEALPACTYDNGEDGVGATLTGNSNGLLAIDGDNVANGQRVLIQNEVDTENNGIYVVTEAGSGGTEFVLTRSVDFNASADIQNGASVICQGGDDNVGKTFYVSSASNPVIGTNAITFAVAAGGDSADLQSDLVIRFADVDGLDAFTVVYDNGIDGVGATLTSQNGDTLMVDGQTVDLDDQVLITERTGVQNGVYKATQLNPFILTRDESFDSPSDMRQGRKIYVKEGALYSSTLWFLRADVDNVGSSPILISTVTDPFSVNAIVAGDNISVDNTDPANPVVGIDVALQNGVAGKIDKQINDYPDTAPTSTCFFYILETDGNIAGRISFDDLKTAILLP